MRIALVLLLAACSKPATSSSGSGPGTGAGSQASDPCSAEAIGLVGATKLDRWTPPSGCTINPRTRDGVMIADQTAFDAQINCAAGSQPFGQPLVVTTRSFSPAQVGLTAFDDGKTITFVSIQRDPCPNDPRPMPGPDDTFAFSVAGSTDPRTFADRACTLPRACP